MGRPVLLHSDERSQLEGIQLLPEVEDADEATATWVASTHQVTGSVDVYVVWSPVYQVPALLFRGYDNGASRAINQPMLTQLDELTRRLPACTNTGGSPLFLDELVRSSLFRTRPDEYPLSTLDRMTHKGLDEGDELAHLPGVTQVEHPNVPELMCYSLHPCETAATLAEVLLPNETTSDPTDNPHSPRKTIQAWFMLVGTVVALS